jgi:peptide/nickel transport system substrate-binding protein
LNEPRRENAANNGENRHMDCTKLRQGRLCVLALGAFAALALTIMPAGAQTRGGTVKFGVGEDIAGFDPVTVGAYGPATASAAALLFNTLTKLDDHGKPTPELALSWTASADFKTWTFKLRPDVKFQDGSPFNAQAVAFNFQRMRNPDNHCRCAAYITVINTIEAADDLTAVYHLNAPQPNWAAQIAAKTVVNVLHSPKAMEEMKEGYNRHPVGTGGFRLKSWQSGDQIVLERNPDYWDKDHVYLDEVSVRPLPDAQARYASLQSGESDVIWDDNADNIADARKNANFAVREYAGSGAIVYVFNMRQPPFDDVRVRQAMRMAIDMPAFAEAVASGVSKPAKDPYGPGSFVQCKDTGLLSYDAAKAKALLADYGKPIDFKLIVTATPRGRTYGQIFQEFWSAVGAKVTIEQVDPSALTTRAFTHNFQLMPWGIIDLADPDPQMYANFHTGSPVNLAGYSNPDVDRLLEDARNSGDLEKRSDDYCEIARILNKDVPWFWALEIHSFAIAKAHLEGIPQQRSGVIDLTTAWWDKK